MSPERLPLDKHTTRGRGDHEPLLTVGRNWSTIPTCSCGWQGPPTYDKGEAVRSAYAHAKRMEDGPLGGSCS